MQLGLSVLGAAERSGSWSNMAPDEASLTRSGRDPKDHSGTSATYSVTYSLGRTLYDAGFRPNADVLTEDC